MNRKNALLNEKFDSRDDGWDLDTLLHPAQAFEHPSAVVSDPDLTLNEKRAILASWASDACAIEAVPALRCPPGGKRPVLFDDVIDALTNRRETKAVPAHTAAWSDAQRVGVPMRDEDIR
jgi:hypothetical protein